MSALPIDPHYLAWHLKMASAESSASLNAPDLGVAAVKTKKPRKSAAPKRTAPGNKRVTAPKGGNWLQRAQAKSLAAREVKESAAYAALKNKKERLIRGVSVSDFDDEKFVVWIEGRGEDGTFENKDGLTLGNKICKEHKGVLEGLAALDPFKPNYPKNSIQLTESKLFPDKEDSTVAWRSVTKVKISPVQQAEPEDAEMTEEGEDDDE